MDQESSFQAELVQGAFLSPTFGKDGSFHVNEAVGSASISPSGRDVVLASREGLHIIDLDNPFSPPRHLPHRTPWEVADVQWSPFASRDYWVVSTSNQKALVWNLELSTNKAPIQYILHAHSRAIADINFSAHDPDKLATCAIDGFVHCWDFRQPSRPVISFSDWYAGATQVKWNRQDPHIIASSHDCYLHIWDERKTVTPLKTINAHDTKIYGIDWNRREATSILTCSPDRTIKFWNTSHEDETPSKVIKTDYPIWRARHTPFGQGVLAMPQRGNTDLHLYDLRPPFDPNIDLQGTTQPVHSFVGHRDQVKEFLWRAQGTLEDGLDQRDFQLVSWSTDRNLLLHRLDDQIYENVGFERGETADERLNFTRKGAIYRTFHEENVEKPEKSAGHGLSSLFRDLGAQGMKKAPIPLTGWDGREFAATSVNGMRVRSTGTTRDANPIEWMKGVKIVESMAVREGSSIPWEREESLGDEITLAGDKYRNVKFEKVDVASRSIALSLSGPWGVDEALVYLKASMKFPDDYPDVAPADVKVERTSSISDASFTRISVEMKVICKAYASIGRGCIEPVLCYLLGEADLQQSLAKANDLHNTIRRNVDSQDDDTSSDEDDDAIARNIHTAMDMEGSGTDLLGSMSVNANANVPLPKACGALWADDGRLICFFPPKNNARSSMMQKFDTASGDHRPRSANLLRDPTRLPHAALADGKTVPEYFDSEEESESSSESSTGFSLSSRDTDDNFGPFKYFLSGGSQNVLGQPIDQHSELNPSPMRPMDNDKQFISLHDFQDILPSKRILAQHYQISGEGWQVCEQNAEVALKHGFPDLADVWHLLGLILCKEVPLEALSQPNSGEDFLILARRALVHIRKRDIGLDLAFDEPDSVVNAKIKGRVKWGNHPLAGYWMINSIFNHFEKVADIQMLAMLSCVLCETERYRDNLQKGNFTKENFPLSPQYFASPAAALGFLSPPSPALARVKLNPPVSATFGSFPSSNGVWSSDDNEAERKQASSDASSPLGMSRQNSRTSHFGQSLSSSPERSMHRSNSTASNAFAASFSRQFASFLTSASSSPPNQTRTPELSTSAPTSGFQHHGVTWAKNVTHREESGVGRAESFQSAVYDFDSESPTKDEDEHFEPEETTVILKNQHLIDDEACLSVPLLDPKREHRYRAYREAYAHLLYIWRLPLTRCEVLKFNFYSDGQSYLETELAPEETENSGSDEANDGLRIVATCLNCGVEHPSARARPAHCERCYATQAGLPCSLCGESVHGLYKSCLACGHVTHLDCVTILHMEDELTEQDECRIGCGCLCDEALDMSVDPHHFMMTSDLHTRSRA